MLEMTSRFITGRKACGSPNTGTRCEQKEWNLSTTSGITGGDPACFAADSRFSDFSASLRRLRSLQTWQYVSSPSFIFLLTAKRKCGRKIRHWVPGQ